MLWSVNDVTGYRLQATDRAIGTIRDFLFDDQTSEIRYVVIDTGGWLAGRRVLIAPAAVGGVRPETRTLEVGLTAEQVEHSPDIAEHQPVSRQEEMRLHQQYGWAPYWGDAVPEATGLAPYWGAAGYGFAQPVLGERGRGEEVAERALEAQADAGDPHLHSAHEVIGYYIEAQDGDIGHVEDLLVEDAAWTIRYIVVDTRNWLPGKKVLVSPQWLREVSWASSEIALDLTRAEIENSPEYDPRQTLDRRFEEALHRHYDRPIYW